MTRLTDKSAIRLANSSTEPLIVHPFSFVAVIDAESKMELRLIHTHPYSGDVTTRRKQASLDNTVMGFRRDCIDKTRELLRKAREEIAMEWTKTA